VLFLALARAKGIPARGRVGFVSFSVEGWWLDHVVVEVWDAKETRWRMVETMAKGKDNRDGAVDLLDLKAGRDFLTGPQAWTAAREGRVDPSKFSVAPVEALPPFLKGWHYLAHNVLHDLAWLDKKEMLLWDHWGVQDGLAQKTAGDIQEELGALLDEISAVTGADGDLDLAKTQAFATRDGLRVPEMVGTVDPAGGGMIKVDISSVIGK
jgi:hypothetical protein